MWLLRLYYVLKIYDMERKNNLKFKDFMNQILKDKKKNLYFSWTADARTVIDDNVQVFYVNGTKGSYSQNNDLKTEFSLSAGLNYDYNFNGNSKFSIALDGLQTSQDTSGIQANLKYKHKF